MRRKAGGSLSVRWVTGSVTGGTTTWGVATMVGTAVSLKPRLEAWEGGHFCVQDRDCIDPCGVRLKFYGGSNSEWAKKIEDGWVVSFLQGPAGRPQWLISSVLIITGMVQTSVARSTAGNTSGERGKSTVCMAWGNHFFKVVCSLIGSSHQDLNRKLFSFGFCQTKKGLKIIKIFWKLFHLKRMVGKAFISKIIEYILMQFDRR